MLSFVKHERRIAIAVDISAFLRKHPCDNVPAGNVLVPNEMRQDQVLCDFLELSKENSFSNGFLRTLQRDAISTLMPIWKWADRSTFIFMRTAFGGLFYKRKANYYVFDPISGDRVNLGSDLEFLLNIALCDDESLKNAFLFDIYKRGVELKGVPQKDECFAFVPALKLGGTKVLSTLK